MISRPPPAWSIDRSGHGDDALLQIGARTLRLDEVRGVESVATAELNCEGHILAVGAFLAAGALLVLPVAMQLLNPRFLAGGILFVGIGLTVLADVLQGRRLVVHRVVMRMADGRRETFASPHAEQCRLLMTALAHRTDGQAA